MTPRKPRGPSIVAARFGDFIGARVALHTPWSMLPVLCGVLVEVVPIGKDYFLRLVGDDGKRKMVNARAVLLLMEAGDAG